MGFASKIAGSAAGGGGGGGGAPPAPPSLRPGQSSAPPSSGPGYPASSSPLPGVPPSPHPMSPPQYQSYNPPGGAPRPGGGPSPSPGAYTSQPPYMPQPQQSPYGQSPQGYGRPAPPPPQGQFPPQQAPYGQPYSPGPPTTGPPYPPGPPGHPGPLGPPGAQYGFPGGSGAAAPPATPQQLAAYKQLLVSTIQEKNLQYFYPPGKLERILQGLAVDAPGRVNKLMREWNVSTEIAMDVMKLSLFDVILYVDDSGSIEFEEGGVRKDQLRQIISTVATAASTFDQDGISVRFMNSMEVGDGIRNADDVNRLVSRVRFQGLTPLGSNLKNKVLDPMIIGPARAGRLEKPVLVITITDGQPAGEPRDTVAEVIRFASDDVTRGPYGRGAISFQFSQVGNDTRAREFLGHLDEDPRIGGLVDCTSNFEVEQDEMSRANPPVYLTRELWCAKLMLGAIDSSYDTKDEKTGGSSGGAPPPAPPGQYGGYGQAPGYNQPPAPPGNYGYSQPPPPSGPPGGPPGGHPGGPPGGYNQRGFPPSYSSGPPPQGGYGQSYGGYGGGPSYQPSYPGYGSPGGYPPQPSPYGGPPPPPRY